MDLKLSEEQFRVLRLKGTESPFTGKYWNNKKKGTYLCVACGSKLFESDKKYDSGCGWPSFYDHINSDKIKEAIDRSSGMVRTEIMCTNCGGHLGHVFDDGPPPT